jgi:DNA modification methylase
MRPYYENGGVTLYLGDCAEWKGSYDLLLTDPPYGQEFKSGKSDKWGAIEGDSDSQGVLERLQIVIQGLKRGRHAYIFGSRLDLSALPLCGITTLIWDKGMIGMGDLSSPWGPQHEEITFAVYELSKANRNKGYGNLAARLRKGSVLRSLRANSGSVRFHPMEKPVDILRQMVESSSMIGETVLDPL